MEDNDGLKDIYGTQCWNGIKADPRSVKTAMWLRALSKSEEQRTNVAVGIHVGSKKLWRNVQHWQWDFIEQHMWSLPRVRHDQGWRSAGAKHLKKNVEIGQGGDRWMEKWECYFSSWLQRTFLRMEIAWSRTLLNSMTSSMRYQTDEPQSASSCYQMHDLARAPSTLMWGNEVDPKIRVPGMQTMLFGRTDSSDLHAMETLICAEKSFA